MVAQVSGGQLEIFEVLRGLASEEFGELAPLFTAETYPAGKVIFREGDPGNKLYFILSGVIQIEKVVDEANSTRLARLGRGELLGEISVLDRSPRTATATSFLDAELLTLTRQQIDTIAGTHPKIAAKFFLGISQSLSKRLRFADDEITQLTKRLYYF